MEVTRRGWRLLGIAGVFVIVGVIAARTIFLLGGAVVLTYVLASQLQFVLSLRTLMTVTTVEQTIDQHRIIVADTVGVRTEVTLAQPVAVPVHIEMGAPVPGTQTGDHELTVPAGETNASAAQTVEFAVAGTYQFPPLRVTVRGPQDLFSHRFTWGDPPTVTVEPRRPRNIHVGQGGEQFVSAYGDHPSDTHGTGMDPAELREYMPGDPANRIDWRATARLNEAFVREFEAETDRRLWLILDTRSSMGAGPPGQSKFDYLREVGLAYLERSRHDGDPVGYTIIDSTGTVRQRRPDAGEGQYEEIRHAFLDADPTATHARDHRQQTQAWRRVTTERLDAEQSQFARQLRPFLGQPANAVDSGTESPLVAAVESAIHTSTGKVWTVVLTDDSQRVQLQKAVNIGRQGSRHVRVLLTPSVLFAPGGITNLDTAYQDYREFEQYRRSLDRLTRVRAFEVGPGDRLDAILARAQRETQLGES